MSRMLVQANIFSASMLFEYSKETDGGFRLRVKDGRVLAIFRGDINDDTVVTFHTDDVRVFNLRDICKWCSGELRDIKVGELQLLWALMLDVIQATQIKPESAVSILDRNIDIIQAMAAENESLLISKLLNPGDVERAREMFAKSVCYLVSHTSVTSTSL